MIPGTFVRIQETVERHFPPLQLPRHTWSHRPGKSDKSLTVAPAKPGAQAMRASGFPSVREQLLYQTPAVHRAALWIT